MATTIVILLPGINALCAAAQDVPKYKVFESIITNGKLYKNKFRDVTLTVVFTSPSDKKKTFWGFYDGNGKGDQVHCAQYQHRLGARLEEAVDRLRCLR